MKFYGFCATVLAVLFIYSSRHENVTANAPLTQIKISVKKPLRMGLITGIKPEKIAYYKELHANTWVGVLKKIKECNIRNFSIYLKKIDCKYYLFSYYEYVGNDYEADMLKLPQTQPLNDGGRRQTLVSYHYLRLQ